MSQKQQLGLSNVPSAPYPPMNIRPPSKSSLSPSPQYSGGYAGGREGTSNRDVIVAETDDGVASKQSAFVSADLPKVARTTQTLPSVIRMLTTWENVVSCINCARSFSRADPIQHPQATTNDIAVPRNRKMGPLLLELRKLELANGENSESDNDFFTTRRIAVSRGNPSLGISVASTCMDLPSVRTYSNHVAAAATGLTTGMLCIHTFGTERDEDGLLSSAIEYYHTPRHHRQASAVAWRPTNHNHVAIGLLGSNASGQQQAARRGGVSIRAGGDREFCCFLWDIESQQSSAKRNSTPMSKLSHNAPVASLAWMMDGQTLAVGGQSRNVQLYDMRVPGSNIPPISAHAHSLGVHGIEVDPHRPYMMATFCRSVGEAVKLWDIRRMDSVSSEIKIPAPKPQAGNQAKVEAVKWATLEPGILSVAIGDAIQDYDTNPGPRPVLVRVNYSRKSQPIRDMALFEGPPRARTNELGRAEESISNKLVQSLYPRRMLVVMDDRTVCDMAKHTVAPVAISRRDGRLVHALGSNIWIGSTASGPSAMEHYVVPHDEDISATMMRRARCNRAAKYSMETAANIKLISEEIPLGDPSPEVLSTRLSLLRLWSWVERVESLSNDAEEMEDDIRWPARGLLDSGIWRLLCLDGGSPADDVAYSEELSCSIFDSSARRQALTSCGWAGKFNLSNVLSECEALGEYERSAALAVWHGDIGAAVKALQRASDSIRHQLETGKVEDSNGSRTYAETLDLVAMCIAGFGARSSSTVWESACSSLLRRDDLSETEAKTSQKAYLRGLCQFLLVIGRKESLGQVLKNPLLSLCDRVAFACRFLDQKNLKEYLAQCIESCQSTGNVEGLVITGLSRDGIHILQSFVDRHADVQTAALVVSRAILPSDWTVERKICLEWVESYRGLLNAWQMWQSRAMFDVDRAEHLRRMKARATDGATTINVKSGNFPTRRTQMSANRRQGGRTPDPDVIASIPAQLDARCNYCSSPLGLRRNEGGTNQWLSKMKSVLSCCPQCRKPLPRCAICLLSMGCLNPYMELTRERSRPGLRGSSMLPAQDDLSQVSNLPFAEWFTWCMRCKHGGHAHHLIGWFANHDVCPVSGCECQCQFDGIQKLSRPALGEHRHGFNESAAGQNET